MNMDSWQKAKLCLEKLTNHKERQSLTSAGQVMSTKTNDTLYLFRVCLHHEQRGVICSLCTHNCSSSHLSWHAKNSGVALVAWAAAAQANFPQ